MSVQLSMVSDYHLRGPEARIFANIIAGRLRGVFFEVKLDVQVIEYGQDEYFLKYSVANADCQQNLFHSVNEHMKALYEGLSDKGATELIRPPPCPPMGLPMTPAPPADPNLAALLRIEALLGELVYLNKRAMGIMEPMLGKVDESLDSIKEKKDKPPKGPKN